jgi:hypothetical protein
VYISPSYSLALTPSVKCRFSVHGNSKSHWRRVI